MRVAEHVERLGFDVFASSVQHGRGMNEALLLERLGEVPRLLGPFRETPAERQKAVEVDPRAQEGGDRPGGGADLSGGVRASPSREDRPVGPGQGERRGHAEPRRECAVRQGLEAHERGSQPPRGLGVRGHHPLLGGRGIGPPGMGEVHTFHRLSLSQHAERHDRGHDRSGTNPLRLEGGLAPEIPTKSAGRADRKQRFVTLMREQ